MVTGIMTNIAFFALVILLGVVSPSSTTPPSYEVPKATIEVYYPKGFQVSIPHEEGITLFAFHGKLNEEMDGLEAGTWARDIVVPKNGRWTFRDRITRLQLGDTLYYWTYVIYKGLGYREDDGVYVVKEYFNTTTTSITPASSTVTKTTGSCSSAVTIVNGAPVRCADQLVFQENFEGNKLDSTKWTVERRIPRAPSHEFCLYLDDVQDVLKLSNGKVRLKPKSTLEHFGPGFSLKSSLQLGNTCTGKLDSNECSVTPNVITIIPPYISAQFSTKKKFSFKYGLVEVRAKMPHAMWITPQLWLEPIDPKYGDSNYNSGQMRIAQTRNDGGQTDLLAGLILNSRPDWHSFKLCLQRTAHNLSQEFHTYRMLWTKDVITFSLDTEEYCRYEIKSEEESFQNLTVFGEYLPNRNLLQGGSKWAPFDQEFYLRVGESIGGFSDFHEGVWSEKKPWVNTDPRAMLHFRNAYQSNRTWLDQADFEIDYIKVFSV